ncbi:hypothetical protein Tco_0739237 [Tanacetum coccineum]
MDDPNITMEEYIRLEEEKARRRGKVYNWETAAYGSLEDSKDSSSKIYTLSYEASKTGAPISLFAALFPKSEELKSNKCTCINSPSSSHLFVSAPHFQSKH